MLLQRDRAAESLTEEGAALLPIRLEASELIRLRAVIAKRDRGPGVRRRSDVYAIRNLLAHAPEVLEPLRNACVRSALETLLGPNFFAVDATLFNKTLGANWKVAYHQDLTIPVRTRFDLPGFGPWSIKGGVPHVQPPVRILERMLAVRLHLDDSDETNGALRIVPGSHRRDRLNAESIRQITSAQVARVLPARAGEILVMRPLCLHASSPAMRPTARRVIHIVLAMDEIILPVGWNRVHTV